MRRRGTASSSLADVPDSIMIPASNAGWVQFREWLDELKPVLRDRGLGYSDWSAEVHRRNGEASILADLGQS